MGKQRHFSVPPWGELASDNASGTWVRVEGGDLPHPFYFRFSLADDGRLVATGLHIEADGELAARDLRIPLASVVSDFLAASAKPATAGRLREELVRGIKFDLSGVEGDELPEAWKWLLPVPAKKRPVRRARPGRRGHPETHYRQVAQAYREAKRRQPRAPIRALMEELHASEPTIHRWLRTARERGYLKGDES